MPQRSRSELPFARMARYGISYRNSVVGITDDILRPKRKGVLGFGPGGNSSPANPLVYVGGALVAFGIIYLIFLDAVL